MHNGEQTAYVPDMDTATGVGGPWSLTEGRNIAAPGEVVLDRILARKNDVHLGDTVDIVDGRFTVVGLSDQTAALGNFYAFISPPDAARLLRAGNRAVLFPGAPVVRQPQRQTTVHRAPAGSGGADVGSVHRQQRDIITPMIGRPPRR